MTGIDRVPEKQRRSVRRRNHLAKDLYQPIYHQKIIQGKKNDNRRDVDYSEYDELPEEDDFEFLA